MLHILLLILKITGIIFAAILGILVLLVCVVLFVPVRYDIEASCDGTLAGVRAKARVTWLLHLVRMNVCYEKKELSWRIRIVWKNIRSGQENNKKIKEEVETYDKEMEKLLEGFEESMEREEEAGDKAGESRKEEKDRRSEEMENRQKEHEKAFEEIQEESGEADETAEKDIEKVQNGGEALEEKAGGSKALEEEKAGGSKALEEEKAGGSKVLEEEKASLYKELEEDKEGREERKGIWQKTAGFCQKIVQKIKALYQKVTGIHGKIKNIIENISGKIKELLEKKNRIYDFISDEVHKKAFLKAKDEGLLLLRKLKPRRLTAEVHYGFEDPYLTGKILAGFSLVYPIFKDNVHVCPDFEQRVLEGRLRISGKIRGSYFVKPLWDLVWCREVRMTYRHVKNFK